MSYVYESFELGLWTVGFYNPDGKFRPESDHGSADAAAERVHFLNGGHEPTARAMRTLVAEMLDHFWPGPRFDGISEGLRDAQLLIDGWRERAGLQRQS